MALVYTLAVFFSIPWVLLTVLGSVSVIDALVDKDSDKDRDL